VSASDSSLPSSVAADIQSKQSSFGLSDLFLQSCRIIAAGGGGFAFGWTVAGRVGALICGALGLVAFAVAEKYNR
jgi:hypothetical protein